MPRKTTKAAEKHRGFSYFPPKIYEKLAERAARNYRSVGKEIAYLIDIALQHVETLQEQDDKERAIV